MFWFGNRIDSSFNLQDDSRWRELSEKKQQLCRTQTSEILRILDEFSRESFDDAIPELIEESGFSAYEISKTLALLPIILNRKSLEKRISAEFTKAEVLDKFVKYPHGSFKARAVPKGIVLHVTAGNVFLSAIDSLVMGLITKNLSIVKVSSQNKFFPLFFASKLKDFDKNQVISDKFAILHWKGGDTKCEDFVKNKVDMIVAWGGEEMISSYQKNLLPHVKLLDFGPKISIQLITEKGLQNKNLDIVAEKIVSDIIPWDQSACASPQNLYLQEGINEDFLLKKIDEAFKRSPPRGHIDEDEATEILKEKFRAYYSELMEGGYSAESSQHLIHAESNKLLRSSPLNRSLIVKRFKDAKELTNILKPFSYYLQSCSYLLGEEEKLNYLDELSLTGIKRFSPLGTITWGMEGAPHDGRFVLRELVNFIGDELRIQNYGENLDIIANSTVLKNHFENNKHPNGHIFSSGGTTGDPKYLHFSYEEFDYITDMLAENFKSQGLKAGMTVANLFVAGNLWSSFMAVEKALEKIGAIQLSIGGMCSPENILLYLKKFRPDAVMGIPSMLVMNAEYMVSKNEFLSIPLVFYAGEALSEMRRNFLSQVWGTKYFGSAGYASVDAGVIGYQCSFCGPGEHHVFSDFIDLNIFEDEAVVTSIIRETMPIKNYRTGDRIEWIKNCECGSSDKRFKLLGRIDDIIFIWSCRLLLGDVEKVMNQHRILTFQLKISEFREAYVLREKLSILIENHSHEIDLDKVMLDIYNSSRDVRDTLTFEDFKKDIQFELLEEGNISRNPRTGKINLVIDQRR